MEIILCEDGRSVIRQDSVVTKGGKLDLRFIGAPKYSTLTILSKDVTLIRTLSSSGETSIEVKHLEGDVKFRVHSPKRVWVSDNVRIIKDSDGNIVAVSLANYPAKFEQLFKEVAEMKKSISELRNELSKCIRDLQEKNNENQIV